MAYYGTLDDQAEQQRFSSNAYGGTLDEQAAHAYKGNLTGQQAEKARAKRATNHSGGWKPSVPTRSALIFPGDLGTSAEQQNYMIFYPKKISGGKADARQITFTNMMDYPCVCLPIPTGLNTTYTQSWSAAQVAGRNSMLADKGGDIIKSMSSALQPKATLARGDPEGRGNIQKGALITDVLSKLTEGFDASSIYNRALGNISSADWWNQAAGGAATEMAAMVAAGPAEGIATASQYNTGMRAVQQTMMSYGGPGFRSFSYTFSLKPMRVVESEVVNGITKLFKELSAPNQQATRYTRVYDLPAVFKIMFYYGGQEHPHIAKVGHCALTSLSITYGGGKFSTFSGTHSPVQTDITLNFQEMELLNRQMLETEDQGGYGWPLQDAKSGEAQFQQERQAESAKQAWT